MLKYETKNILELLCKLISLLLGVHIRSDDLISAKYNNANEAVVVLLWNIINKFIHDLSAISLTLIKDNMRSLQYPDPLFYELTLSAKGGQDLLIAIAFLIPLKLQAVVEEHINKSIFTSNFTILDVENENEFLINSTFNRQFKKDSDKLNYYLWVKGRISQLERRRLELKALNNKILFNLGNCVRTSMDDYTINEIVALSSKKYCLTFLRKTGWIFGILELYTQWKKKQKVFWQWMQSVLEEREKRLN